MTLFKKLLAATAFTAVTAAIVTDVTAITQDVEVLANFREAIIVNSTVDLDFSDVDLDATPGAGDVLTVGTDGAYAAAVGFAGAGTPVAGNINFDSGTGLNIDVTCNATATLTDGGANSIQAVAAGWDFNATSTAATYANACDGAADTVVSTGTDDINIGAQLDGSTITGTLAGAFSSASAGGTALTFDIVYN